MAVPSQSAPTKRPKNALIAYAIALVRSKPPELTNRGMSNAITSQPCSPLLMFAEYLRIIAQHFAKGRRADALSSTYHHLDRSSWWRSEYERQKRATTVAEEEVLDLKLEVDRLKAKIETANPTKKRKRVDEDVVPVPRSPKKSKPNEPTTKKASSASEGFVGFDFGGIGEVGKFTLHAKPFGLY